MLHYVALVHLADLDKPVAGDDPLAHALREALHQAFGAPGPGGGHYRICLQGGLLQLTWCVGPPDATLPELRMQADHAPAQRARMGLVRALVQSRRPTAVDAAAWRHGQRCPASSSCALAGKQRHTLDVCPALATAPQPPADPHGMGPAPALHRGRCRLERCRHRPGPGSAGLAGAGSRGGRAARRRRLGRTGRFGQRAAQPRRCAAITMDDARCDADAPISRQQLA